MQISVAGQSSITLPAECVIVSVTLGFTGDDRAVVMRDTAALADAVRAKLDAVVADEGGSDARLTGLRTWTKIRYDDKGRPQSPQHVAEVRGSVRVKDLSRVAGFLGDLSSTDGVQIGSLDWRLYDETLASRKPEVLAGAYANAVERAEWIAKAAGKRVLEVTSIEDGGAVSYAQPRMRMAAAMAYDESAPAFDLDPEDVEVSASLNVRFEAVE